MNPDLVFVVGVVILALAFPAAISAFSSSDVTVKPAIICVVVGSSLIVLASSMSSGGYSVTEIPAIVMRLLK